MKRALGVVLVFGVCLMACDAPFELVGPESRSLGIRLEDSRGRAVPSYEIAVMEGEPTGATPWETQAVIGRNAVAITPSPWFEFVNNPEGEFGLILPAADIYTVHVRIEGKTLSTTIAVAPKWYGATPLHLRLDEDGRLSVKETARIRKVEPRKTAPSWAIFDTCSIEVEVAGSGGHVLEDPELELALLHRAPTGRTPWETRAGEVTVPGPPALMPLMNGRCWWNNLLPSEAYTFFVKHGGATTPLTVHLAPEPDDQIRGIIRITEDGTVSFEETERRKEVHLGVIDGSDATAS